MPAAAGGAEGLQAAARAASDRTRRSPGQDGGAEVKVHSAVRTDESRLTQVHVHVNESKAAGAVITHTGSYSHLWYVYMQAITPQ